jgi:hypothetical protein
VLHPRHHFPPDMALLEVSPESVHVGFVRKGCAMSKSTPPSGTPAWMRRAS